MQCTARKKDGRPCGNRALRSGDRCFWHAEGAVFDSLRADCLRRAATLAGRSRGADVREIDAALKAQGWPPGLRRYVVRAYVRGSVGEGRGDERVVAEITG